MNQTPYEACDFLADIRKMNEMYDLPIEDRPSAEIKKDPERILRFENILHEEVTELHSVYLTNNGSSPEDELWHLTELADVLGDVVVFCFSEAQRNGIPLMSVLQIIMQSNFSKLGADGKPIKDERGKFLKGPNYWKPEEKIKKLLTLCQQTPDTTVE